MTSLTTAITKSLQILDMSIELKDFQRNVINAYVKGRDCFCVAPTGAEKSITYTICPLVMDFMTGGSAEPRKEGNKITIQSAVLIVQPLKSLMKDQKSKLMDMGLNAIYVGEEKDTEGLLGGSYNYIITSPESAVSPSMLSVLGEIKHRIKCVFIDESHCIQTL